MGREPLTYYKYFWVTCQPTLKCYNKDVHTRTMQPQLTTEDISGILKQQYASNMKSAQLTPQIKYVSLSDEEGTFGLMILQTSNPKIREVHSHDDFVQCYNEFSSLFTS